MEELIRSPWNPTRQCTATSRSGDRCRRQPIPGGEVCVSHGGRAPQVQRSAKQRLLEGADLAIDYLLNLLAPKPPCEHCGRSDADRDPVVVKACQLVLDRSGFHPTLIVEARPAVADKLAGLTEDEMIEQAEATIVRVQRQLDLLRSRRALNEVEDGFIVPDEDAIQDSPVQIPVEIETPDDGKDDK